MPHQNLKSIEPDKMRLDWTGVPALTQRYGNRTTFQYTRKHNGSMVLGSSSFLIFIFFRIMLDFGLEFTKFAKVMFLHLSVSHSVHAGRGCAVAVYVGCICDPVISVRVLRLSHNNSLNYS